MVFGEVMLPASGYLDLVCMVADQLGFERRGAENAEVLFRKPLVLGEGELRAVQIVCKNGQTRFRSNG